MSLFVSSGRQGKALSAGHFRLSLFKCVHKDYIYLSTESTKLDLTMQIEVTLAWEVA